MLNKYPLWKNLLLIGIVIFGFIYAIPNLFGEDPAVQIASTKLTAETQNHVQDVLQKASIPYQSSEIRGKDLLIRFTNTDLQLKAKDLISSTLGDDYSVSLNLAPATPHWLTAIGATPMKLGLDLRGGIHFSLDVDINSVLAQRSTGLIRSLPTELRQASIRYQDIQLEKNNVIVLKFRQAEMMTQALNLLRRQFPDYQFTEQTNSATPELRMTLTAQGLETIRQATVEQTMSTLRNRVNELGIAEAIVQQQGANRISVDLPGIQDTARAREILGGTATLEFRMVDQDNDPQTAAQGQVPPGSTLYTYEGRPLLLKNQVLLTGSSITDSSAGFGEDGRASVNIRLGGGGEAAFHRYTGQNVGKLLAIVYVETKLNTQTINGQPIKTRKKIEKVISAATIRSALPANFQITGLRDPKEAQDLSLLLRAGALPATIDIVEERTLGPKLGMQNIEQGIKSVLIGLAILVIFITFYYRLFGVIANIGLVVNLILLVAVLSSFGMTLTMPGIAGIVLTLGMAIDANVLIFERIREELRNGLSIQASIHAGYERAFTTILDANITTLIVAFVLFGLGSGAIKGFAVTLSVGILTSMLTSISVTRALVNAIYGGRPVKKLSIGI